METLEGDENMSTKKVTEEIIEPKEELVKEKAPAKKTTKKKPEVKKVLGVVTECALLKVRKTPEVVDDNILDEIPLATEVFIDMEKSTEEFYKVTTAAGLDGFCMKKFINIGEN